ncbi:putative Topless family protein [Helianthus annuus]|nr:putative Topless family protein [Helianthus annuus]KAJ0710263.1 putative Topless family protein [Helianthus annuus]
MFKSKLKGHSKHITGLAFSHVLNMLVSSGVDAQWIQGENSAMISHATFSCDQLMHASFFDAIVCVFTASHLRLRCKINPSVYLTRYNKL